MVHAGPQGALGTSEIQLKKEAPEKAVRQRDPDATKARILEAAKREFAKLGFGGARVDSIAARAKANKRMIYHYFSSKEELFTAVLEDAYLAIRAAERKLSLEHARTRGGAGDVLSDSRGNIISPIRNS